MMLTGGVSVEFQLVQIITKYAMFADPFVRKRPSDYAVFAVNNFNISGIRSRPGTSEAKFRLTSKLNKADKCARKPEWHIAVRNKVLRNEFPIPAKPARRMLP